MTDKIESYLCGTWQFGSGSGSTLVNPATEETLAVADTTGLDFKADSILHAEKVALLFER